MMDQDAARQETLLGTEIFTFKEGRTWVACWRRFDVVSQGRTEKEAVQRLLRTIAFQAIIDAREGNMAEFGCVHPPPAKELDRWMKLHAKTHHYN